MHTPKCFNNHMGAWAIEPKWFGAQVDLFKAGRLPTLASEDEQGRLYGLTREGVALVALCGPLMKERSKYGGTSTIRARQAIREAAQNDSVKSILLYIDSPGGSVAGTQELAADVRQANLRKPVLAHADDLMASAALWIGTQCRYVTANEMALVGSIGIVCVIEDSSKAAEMQGIKIHIVSSGPHKGAGTPGTQITPAVLAEEQKIVDAFNEKFVAAVAQGRRMAPSTAWSLATGEVWIAAASRQRGLIDEVCSLDAALSRASYEGAKASPKRSAQAEREEIADRLEDDERIRRAELAEIAKRLEATK